MFTAMFEQFSVGMIDKMKKRGKNVILPLSAGV